MPTANRIVYKVVRHFEKDLYISAIVASRLCLEYRLGEVTSPQVRRSYIYAFSSLEYAEGFLLQMHDSEEHHNSVIVRCEADVASESAVIYYDYDDSQGIEMWWWYGRRTGQSADPPPGTIWCRWVKPIEEVHGVG